ncbi:MAG: DUF357 domain-containing protein [Thermoplasmataceae archaeon]
MSEIEDRIIKYIGLEKKALDRVRICVPEDSFLFTFASDALGMVKSYFDDAQHFYEKGDLLNAFAALNYSYGWLDSMVRLGVLDGGSDDSMFTLFK